MSRRLLALLAILSGLAALHAPVNAAQIDDLSYDIEALAEMVNSNGSAACQCEQPPKKPGRACEKQTKKAVRPRFIGIVPPPVVVGSDFALE